MILNYSLLLPTFKSIIHSTLYYKLYILTYIYHYPLILLLYLKFINIYYLLTCRQTNLRKHTLLLSPNDIRHSQTDTHTYKSPGPFNLTQNTLCTNRKHVSRHTLTIIIKTKNLRQSKNWFNEINKHVD